MFDVSTIDPAAVVASYAKACKCFDSYLDACSKLSTAIEDAVPNGTSSTVRYAIDKDRGLRGPNVSTVQNALREEAWKSLINSVGAQEFLGNDEAYKRYIDSISALPFDLKNVRAQLASLDRSSDCLEKDCVLRVFDYLTNTRNFSNASKKDADGKWTLKKTFGVWGVWEVWGTGRWRNLRWKKKETIDDIDRAICIATKRDFAKINQLWPAIVEREKSIKNDCVPDDPFESEFFIVRDYQNGNIRCTFKNTADLDAFNAAVKTWKTNWRFYWERNDPNALN